MAGIMTQQQTAQQAPEEVLFPRLIAQERVRDVLARAVQVDRLPHAYLFLGPDGVGKEAAALDLVQSLLCLDEHRRHGDTPDSVPCGTCASCVQVQKLAHPNLKVLFPLPKPKEDDPDEATSKEMYSAAQQKAIDEVLAAKREEPYARLSVPGGQEILIEHIRALRHEFRLTSFSGGWRIVILSQADRLRVQAANAFLKLLEEPPPNVMFILTSSRESRLLSTIVSRCQILRFPPLPEATLAEQLQQRRDVDGDTAHISARLAEGSWTEAVHWSGEDPGAEMSRVVDLLRTLAKGDPGAIDALVDKVGTGAQAQDLPGLLGLLSRWLRDVQRYDAAPEAHPELARDPALVKFAQFTRGRDFGTALEEVEQARLDVERRVQPALVMHRLFLALRRALFVPAGGARA